MTTVEWLMTSVRRMVLMVQISESGEPPVLLDSPPVIKVSVKIMSRNVIRLRTSLEPDPTLFFVLGSGEQ